MPRGDAPERISTHTRGMARWWYGPLRQRVATLGLPDSPGVPASATATTLVCQYNDLEGVKKLFEANKGEIAGVILEPVVGNSGFIPPTQEFLQGLRDVTKAEGALLCFDEVMTGFRIAKGCAQEHFGI